MRLHKTVLLHGVSLLLLLAARIVHGAEWSWKSCPDAAGSATVHEVAIDPETLSPGHYVRIVFTVTTHTTITGGKVEGTFRGNLGIIPPYNTDEPVCAGWATCPQSPGESSHVTNMYVPRIAFFSRRIYGRLKVTDQDGELVSCIEIEAPVGW